MSYNKLEIKNYQERISFLTSILKENHFDPSKDDRIIDLKQKMRRMIKMGSRQNYFRVINQYDEGETHVYKIYLDDYDYDDFQKSDFVNLKDYVKDFLWRNYAQTVSQYDYSPTGLWFTSNFYVAHVKDNEYLVHERLNLDI